MKPKTSFGLVYRPKKWCIIAPLMRDNSANKLLFASLLEFESHYPSPMAGLIPLTLQTAPRLFSASVINSTGKYYCTMFVEHLRKEPKAIFKDTTSRNGIIFEFH